MAMEILFKPRFEATKQMAQDCMDISQSKNQSERKICIYMLFASWEVRIVKNCDRGLENAARGRRPRAAISSPRSQFFTIRTDPKPANNLSIFFLL